MKHIWQINLRYWSRMVNLISVKSLMTLSYASIICLFVIWRRRHTILETSVFDGTGMTIIHKDSIPPHEKFVPCLCFQALYEFCPNSFQWELYGCFGMPTPTGDSHFLHFPDFICIIYANMVCSMENLNTCLKSLWVLWQCGVATFVDLYILVWKHDRRHKKSSISPKWNYDPLI